MKNRTNSLFIACLIVGLFFSLNYAKAQGNLWKINGNNNIDTGNFIGSLNSAPLKFKTDGQLRMHIDKKGLTHINAIMVTDSAIFTGPITISNGNDAFRPMPGFLGNDVIGVTTRFFDVTGVNPAGPPAPLPLLGMGVNIVHPNFMLDVFCDHSVPTNMDINISSPAFGPFRANDIGYRIGGQYVLWHNGDPSNILVGVGAGSGGGSNNVFVGNNADNSATGKSHECVILGTSAGFSNQGAGETFAGYQAGQNNSMGDFNTYVGNQSGKSGETVGLNSAADNAFFGSTSGVANLLGQRNTYLGASAGSSIGNNPLTSFNDNLNTFVGDNSGSATLDGAQNVFLGATTGASHVQGRNNMALGFQANLVSPMITPLHNANAIGFNSVAVASNTMILGGNNDIVSSPPVFATWVGIGFEASSPAPGNSLEINARNQATGAVRPNWSGLRFTNLTAANTPGANVGNMGVLALDLNGNVIYVNGSGAGGIGICSAPTILPAGGGALDLQTNGVNFYFDGNGSTKLTDNSVLIGRAPGSCANPVAKLDVLQNSLATLASKQASVGINIENDDKVNVCGSGINSYVVGTNTFVPGGKAAAGNYYIGAAYNVPGSICKFTTSPAPAQYAIFVKPAGGLIDINYPLGTIVPNTVDLEVAGDIWYRGTIIPSDSILKSNVQPIMHGLDVMRKIHPVSYQYNGKGGITAGGTSYGLIAQQVVRVAPYAVDSGAVYLDSTSTSLTPILAINEQAIVYTAINAIKQLDSAVSNQHNVGGMGTPNYVAKFTDSNTIANSLIYDNGYFLGIGTQQPGAHLDIESNGGGGPVYNVGMMSSAFGAGPSGEDMAIMANAPGSATYEYGLFASSYYGTAIYGTTMSGLAGYFNGDVVVTGNFNSPSDSTLKNNVDSIHNCSNILKCLKPHTYTFDTVNYPSLHLQSGTHYGLIAQEVERTLPNLVKTVTQPPTRDSAGNIIHPSVTYKSLNYMEFIPLLVKGYQDEQSKNQSQQQTIDSLRNMMHNLQDCINRLCNSDRSVKPGNNNNGGGSDDNVTNVTLSNSAILYQNIPNPFSTGTKINYYIPEGAMGAALVFFDMYGNKLKEVQLSKTGAGTINVTPDNLTNGMYSYSLIVNGQVIDTKKMVLNR